MFIRLAIGVKKIYLSKSIDSVHLHFGAGQKWILEALKVFTFYCKNSNTLSYYCLTDNKLHVHGVVRSTFSTVTTTYCNKYKINLGLQKDKLGGGRKGVRSVTNVRKLLKDRRTAKNRFGLEAIPQDVAKSSPNANYNGTAKNKRATAFVNLGQCSKASLTKILKIQF